MFWFVVAQLIAQTLLATLILAFFLLFVDGRAFNVIERRPHYQLADGSEARLPQKDWYPLQSDITTIISGAFNLLGKLYSAWIAVMTWNYAFLLLEKNGMKLASFSSMVSLPIIPALFPPPGFETEPPHPTDDLPRNHGSTRKWLAVSIALTMVSVFPASFSPPIATGSISWHASTHNISNADIIHEIGIQGANYGNINPWASWCGDLNFRPRYISRASALAVHAWNSVSNVLDSAPTSKRVVPSVQSLPVGTSLTNVTVPVFAIESFDWITDGSDVSSTQLDYLTRTSTPGTLYPPLPQTDVNNPLQSTPGVLALLPDAIFDSSALNSDWSTQQPSMIKSKAGVVAVNINYAGECDASTFAIFGPLPPNLFTSSAKNVWGYSSCFVFAKITYSAGAATCYGCEVIFPLVVQNPPGVDLVLQPDVATQQAMYLMADVIGQLASSNVTMPIMWNNIENYTKEVLVRGYSSAWTVISEMFAFYSSKPSTFVTIPIPTSRAFVDRRRLWGWYALQVLAFVGGVIFLLHIHMEGRYPISNPLIHGFMLDVDMSPENKELAREYLETWPEDFRETFMTWERGSKKSALTIQDRLKPVRIPSVAALRLRSAYHV